MFGFQITRIWSLNPKAMKDKKIPNSSYTLVNMSKEERDDTISNEEDETILWEKQFVTIKLINVITIKDHEFTTTNVFQINLGIM